MPKQIIIAEQHRIAAVFSEDQIQELVVATGSHQVGDIFLGTVENVLPGIDAAFVNIGDSERNGFIHVTDLGPLKLKRSAASITELLVPQQKVLVQVMKEPTGNKGPRLTGNVTLPGRYLVLMPFGRGVSLSRRIPNENDRNHLRALAILIKPPGMGLLVRTEAEGMAEEAIIEDLEALQKQWETILQEASSTRAPALLNRDDDFIQRVLRDFYSVDVNRVVVDSHMGMKRVKQNITVWSGGKSSGNILVEQHPTQEAANRDSTVPILEYFRVNAAIREALKPRVDLPSGGYIIIERTEALTVIDVNSGSFTRSETARETVLWTNFEAATEIARQLRLRNIAGVIIVDFIDMDSHRDKLQVLEHFTKALRADKARPQIAQLTELGLVELTRKRQGQNIYELFSRPCSTCGGLGHLVHLPGDPENHVESLERVALRDHGSSDSRSAEPRNREPSRDRRARGRTAVPAPYPEPDFLPLNAGLPTGLRLPSELPVTPEDVSLTDDRDSTELDAYGGYPERGNRRRRRRRDGGREGGRDSGREGGRPPRDTNADSNLYRRRGALVVDEETAVESDSIVPGIVVDDSPAREGWTERSDRRSRREPRSPIHPPERISVVMTPEEQDVYALMGISPLLMMDPPIKDTRSVIISVLSPGEETTIPTASEPVESLDEAAIVEPEDLSLDYDAVDEASDDDEDMEIEDGLGSDLDQEDDLDSVDDLDLEPVAAFEVDDDFTEASEDPKSMDAVSEPAVELPNRRRRRRSSATDGD